MPKAKNERNELDELKQCLVDREAKFAEREQEFVDRLKAREAAFASREAAFEEQLKAMQASDD